MSAYEPRPGLVVDESAAARYRSAGWWGDDTVGNMVTILARERPEATAFVADGRRFDYRSYDRTSDRLASTLVAAGTQPGERIAVLLPDGATAHAVYLANEKAGLTTVGLGSRAGSAEMRSIIERTGASALITQATHRGRDGDALYADLGGRGSTLSHHVVVPAFEFDPEGDITVDGRCVVGSGPPDGRRIGPDDLFMVNSTSGTTGMPKCVMHSQNSKFYMAKLARQVAELEEGEVILGGAPIPFGFGLFTTHFLPVLLGGTAVVMSHFDPREALELIESERATVLVCVSTQFKMMLNVDTFDAYDLSSLKVMFTGGEMIPYRAARSFEERSGAKVLNFYGSNESGFATGTRSSDTAERRLRTGGSRLDGTEVRLFDNGVDVTGSGRGQPGSRGPATCLGYYGDPEANAELFTSEGFVLHADIVEIGRDGYLTVVGRKSDIIIRGGKNISAAVVEESAMSHPAISLAAAVPMPDRMFGERVSLYVELRPGASVTLAELQRFLADAGVSKEVFPEDLVVVEEIPRSSGAKVAKGDLRQDAARRSIEAESKGSTVR
jgi:acyl-CoA synthetase